MSDDTQARIKALVESNKVLLFMKGTRFFPQCGFSARAVGVLQHLDTTFHTVDVLADPAIRQGIKQYSSWPTIPQLYVNGEFLGGSDIMLEMYHSGELAKIIAGEGGESGGADGAE